MKDQILRHFQLLAEEMGDRSRTRVEITLKSGRVLKAAYDPLFETITLGGMTFPVRELSFWTKLCWGSEPESVFATP